MMQENGLLLLVACCCCCCAGEVLQVHTLEWNKEEGCAPIRRMFDNPWPTVLRGSFVESMQARQWTTQRIASLEPLPVEMVAASARTLVPYVSKSKRLFPPPHSAKQFVDKSKVRETLDSLLHNKSASTGLYYSAEVAHTSSLWKDFSPSECLPHKPSLHLWASRGSPTAALHYDAEQNLYLQVAGKKRFSLFPPSELSRAKLFPFLSALSRQSALDAEEWFPLPNSAEEGEEVPQNVSFVDVLLEPGMLFYLPPFWMHRVSCETDMCLSANVWCHAEEILVHNEELPSFALPMEMEWSDAQKAASLRHWGSLLANEYDKEFAKVWLRDRYALIPDEEQTFEPCKEKRMACGFDHAFEHSWLIKAARYAEPVRNALLKIKDTNIRSLVLAGYLEKAAHILFGEQPCKTVQWMLQCCTLS